MLLPLLLCFAATAGATEIPAGTDLHVRLTSKVSSKDSKAKENVTAVLIQPVFAGEQLAIPAGTTLQGHVLEAKPFKADQKAALSLQFTEIKDSAGASAKITTKIVDVENAREFVEPNGAITGIDPSQTISARLDQGLGKLGGAFGQILATAKSSILKAPDPDIIYDPGAEMTLKLTAPLAWQGKAKPIEIGSFPDQNALFKLVNAQPFRTVAASPPKPSDMTNLMFVGTADELKSVFKEAGWVEAATLSGNSKFETFKSIAESRGYKEAPMSILLLDGQKPDFDYEKQLNTFAMRHHLRIWARPDTVQGKPVWVCAATHDTGIELSQEQHTFIHKIDPNIDRERAKVVNDLLFTGKVKALALADRPQVPQEAMNATGDKILTDGRMAVLMF